MEDTTAVPVAIGSDHAGYRLKTFLAGELAAMGYDIQDCGTDSEESVDYPDFAAAVCSRVRAGRARFGILICNTGIGVSIAANKFAGIRAALCHTEFTAAMARQHNDANVLTLGGAVLGNGQALWVARTFLAEAFSQGERHRRRIEKIAGFEGSR